MLTYTVYGLYENINSIQPFYIGFTQRNSDKRLYQHLYDVKRGTDTNSIKSKLIKNLLSKNEIPVLKILNQFDNITEALNKEIELISLLGRICNHTGILTNISSGGQGSPIHKRNRNLNGSNNPMYGKKHTEECKRLISEHKKGKQRGIENGMFGKKRPDLSKRNKQGRKPVYQLDLNNNIIKLWPSLTDAANTLNLNKRNMSACTKPYKYGRCQTTGGFKWKYV